MEAETLHTQSGPSAEVFRRKLDYFAELKHGFNTEEEPADPFGSREADADAILKGYGTSFQGIRDHYPISMTIDARIIEVTEESVTMECLMIPSERVFQERVFDRALLDGAVPVRLGQFVQIRVFQKPGKIVHAFFDGSKLVRKELFEYEPLLEEEDYL